MRNIWKKMREYMAKKIKENGGAVWLFIFEIDKDECALWDSDYYTMYPIYSDKIEDIIKEIYEEAKNEIDSKLRHLASWKLLVAFIYNPKEYCYDVRIYGGGE